MEDILVNGEHLSENKFKKPSREFGIMPFWFWNGEMDYDEMEYQLREFYAKGVPGIFIHARFGIKNYMGYLSDDWFDRVKFTIEKAQQIGLQVWVYDEYNWPSGTADHRVMKENPELTERYLQLIEVDVPGQFFTFLEGTDSRYTDMEQSEPVYACAILEDDLKNGRMNFIDLTPSLSFDKVIPWEAPKGPWKLFYFIERKASWYIDALDSESTKKFLELTHEKYKAAMGGNFKDNIRGFYTDEPAMHYFENSKDNMIIPWSRKMFKVFRDANGYDLKPHLPELFFDFGGDTAKFRYDFWRTLSDKYEESYYTQISNWCEKNNVVFTGHLLYEEWLRRHARTGGNLFHQLRHFKMIGVDHLYPRIGNREMPDEHVALKIASSAAHQFGSTRLVCESLGGSYWNVTMERMKWIADWEYMLGVNLFNPHGFHYSIEGERKRDWPPSQFYHHTWWKDYKVFNDYVTRMGYILSGGRHVAKIAVLYPINSIWTNYMPQERNAIGSAIESDFNYLTDTLLRLHTDFDYIDEDVMKDAVIRDGKLCIRDEEYSALFLPPVTHIKESTLCIMENFYKAGGRIIGDALLPVECLEGQGDGFTERIERLFGVSPLEILDSFKNNRPNQYGIKTNKNGNSGKAVFIYGPGLYLNKPFEVLKKAVMECITPEIEIDSDEVFYLHRAKDGRDFYFIINPVEDGREINVDIVSSGRPQVWNLENGDITDLPVFRRHGDKVGFKLYMQPFGSKLVSFSDDDNLPHVEETNIVVYSVDNKTVSGYGRIESEAVASVCKEGHVYDVHKDGIRPLEPIRFSKDWSFKVNHENALLVNNWKVAVDSENTGMEKGFCSGDFDDSSWMDFKMGAWEMQLPEEWDSDAYPATLWYRTTFDAEYVPDDIKVLIDGFKGKGYVLFVNGICVTEKPQRSYLDSEIKEIRIGNYVKTGTNSLAVKLTVSNKSDGILDMLKITGSFMLGKKDGKYYIVKPSDSIETGSWTKQGYPYFSGTGEYKQIINVDKEYTGKVLKLNMDCGTDLVEVVVNGNNAGLRPWHPYELDITPYIKQGENEITVKVTNTLINLLEGVEQDSGIYSIKIVPYDIYKFDI